MITTPLLSGASSQLEMHYNCTVKAHQACTNRINQLKNPPQAFTGSEILCFQQLPTVFDKKRDMSSEEKFPQVLNLTKGKLIFQGLMYKSSI